MKIHRITLIAYAAVVATFLAWGAFAMFAWNIWSEEARISSHTSDAETITERQSVSLRLHSLARDTKDARDQLDGLTGTEVLGIANIIESVGKSTGVTVTIRGATPDSLSQKSSAESPVLHSIIFAVEAEGTFSSIMHTAQLFENLPVLSSVQSLELNRVQDDGDSSQAKKQLWRLSISIKVMTTAKISS